MSFEFELVCETLCQMRDLQFFCLWVVAVVPEQNPQKPTRKKAYSANIYFYAGLFEGSASVAVRAGPQWPFPANSKRVLRAGGMRGLLELLSPHERTHAHHIPMSTFERLSRHIILRFTKSA